MVRGWGGAAGGGGQEGLLCNAVPPTLPPLPPPPHRPQRELRRRDTRAGSGSVAPPPGPYTFQAYEAWQRPGLTPPPAEALKLLHRLAADPGTVGVMNKHRWTVGLLRWVGG